MSFAFPAPACTSERLARSVELLYGIDGLEQLACQRRQLDEAFGRCAVERFLAWFDAHLHAWEQQPEGVVFALVRRGGLPELVLPLRRTPCVPAPGLVLDNHPEMPSGDYLLVRGEDIGGGIADLVAALPDRWRHIELPHVDERVRDLFRNLAQTRVLVRCRQTGNCDHLAIATVEDLHGHLSGNLRSKLRKWHRRLERRGPVSFERYDQPEQLDQAYHEFLEVESSGWKGVDGERTALKLIPAKREFYRRLLHNFAGFSTAAVCLMRLDGRAVAGQVLLESEGTIYQLKIGYDESYASCAPGNLLLDHVLKTAAQRSGIHTYNLVSGAQWHRRWRAASEARYRITLYRRTFTGRFCMLLDDLAFELRCAVHRWLRPIYRRLLGKTSEAA